MQTQEEIAKAFRKHKKLNIIKLLIATENNLLYTC